MSYETKHKGKTVQGASIDGSKENVYGLRVAPGITMRTDYMTPEQLAAESGPCIVVKKGTYNGK